MPAPGRCRGGPPPEPWASSRQPSGWVPRGGVGCRPETGAALAIRAVQSAAADPAGPALSGPGRSCRGAPRPAAWTRGTVRSGRMRRCGAAERTVTEAAAAMRRRRTAGSDRSGSGTATAGRTAQIDHEPPGEPPPGGPAARQAPPCARGTPIGCRRHRTTPSTRACVRPGPRSRFVRGPLGNVAKPPQARRRPAGRDREPCSPARRPPGPAQRPDQGQANRESRLCP